MGVHRSQYFLLISLNSKIARTSPYLKLFQNCRRSKLLKELGDSVPSSSCCDVCVLDPKKGTRAVKPKPVRKVSPQELSYIKTRLLRERRRLIESSVGFRALGGTVACPVLMKFVIELIVSRI